MCSCRPRSKGQRKSGRCRRARGVPCCVSEDESTGSPPCIAGPCGSGSAGHGLGSRAYAVRSCSAARPGKRRPVTGLPDEAVVEVFFDQPGHVQTSELVIRVAADGTTLLGVADLLDQLRRSQTRVLPYGCRLCRFALRHYLASSNGSIPPSSSAERDVKPLRIHGPWLRACTTGVTKEDQRGSALAASSQALISGHQRCTTGTHAVKSRMACPAQWSIKWFCQTTVPLVPERSWLFVARHCNLHWR